MLNYDGADNRVAARDKNRERVRSRAIRRKLEIPVIGIYAQFVGRFAFVRATLG